LIEKTPWTIYDQKDAEVLIADCAKHIKDLENYIKIDARALDQLARNEIEEVRQILSLLWMGAAAQTVDSVMKRWPNKSSWIHDSRFLSPFWPLEREWGSPWMVFRRELRGLYQNK
jgi:hypothetical protein